MKPRRNLRHLAATLGLIFSITCVLPVAAQTSPGVTLSKTSVTVTEASGDSNTDTYTVVLNTQPTGDVTIAITGGDTSIATVSPTSLTFTTGDWDTPQTVTVTGQDEDIDHGVSKSVTIYHTPSGRGYGDRETVLLSVNVLDDDIAGITVTETSGSTATTEAGGADTISVVLDTEPTAHVTIAVSSSDITEGTVDKRSLVFTASNWSTPQIVTVTGQDDNLADGDQSYNIVLAKAVSGDVHYGGSLTVYNAINPPDVTVTNTDDDAGVILSTSAVTVTEASAGRSTNYTVKLSTRPSGAVTITPTSSNSGVATVSAALTFTTTNWNAAQTITVTGVDDSTDGDRTTTITHTVTGADYASVSAASVVVTLTDDDNGPPAGAVTITGTATQGQTLTADTSGISDPDGPSNLMFGYQWKRDGAAISGATSSTYVLTQADVGAAITVTVSWTDAGNTAESLTAVAVLPSGVTVLAAPAGLKVIVRSGKIKFRWEIPNNPAITRYQYKYWTGTPESGSWADISGSDKDTTSHVVTGLTDGTEYNFRIRAIAGSVTGTPSGVITVTPSITPDVPARPAAVTAVAGNGQVTLSWDNPNNAAITRYQIRRQVAPEDWGNWADISGSGKDTTSYTVTGLTNNIWHRFRIRAIASTAVYGLASSDVSARPMASPSPPPSKPTGLAAVAGDGQVTLSWNNPNNAAITRYQIRRQVASEYWGNWADISGSGKDTTSYTVTGLTNNIWHRFRIRAVAGSVTGTPSDVMTVTPGRIVTLTDDDTAGVTLSKSSVTVTEASGSSNTNTYTVKLNTRPSGTVTVTPTSGDAGVARVSPASLTFTTTNWNAAQTITVTGVDDSSVADRSTTITHTISGGGYGSVVIPGVSVTLTDDDTAGVTLSKTSVTVTEASGNSNTNTYTVKLNTRPSSNVIVTPTSGNTDVATVSAALTFTTSNWNTAQTITVTGVDDSSDGDRSTTISHAASGGGYNAVVIPGVSVTLTDDDTAGVTVSKSSVTVTEASGGSNTNTYTVKLNTQPTGAVTVTPTSSNTGVATVSPASLTFTASTWNAAQTITVTGVDDSSVGDRTTTISHTISGGGYGSVSIDDVAVTLTDDDTAGVTLSESSVTVTEASGNSNTNTYTVVLNTRPSGTVTVTPTSSNTGVATVSPASLTFTTSNWNTAQSITVTGVDDSSVGERSTAITHTISGGGYGSVSIASVSVTLTDDDNSAPTGTVTITGTATQGQTLTADTSGISDPDGLSNLTFSYQWKRGGNPISGATSRTYTLTQADVGAVITVTVSWTGGGGTAESFTSTTTASVTNANDPPTGAVTITGTATQGQTLTADTSGISDPDGPSNLVFSYQWKRDGNPISGATQAAYILTQADVGKAITVTVSWTDAGRASETLTSAATSDVASAVSPPTVTLALDRSSISESGSGNVATVTATLSAASSAATEVTVTAAAVSPALPGDFTLSSNKLLTIAAGATTSTGTVTITAVDNDVDAPDKTVTVSGAASGGNGVADPSALTLTITDDDAAPTVTLALSPSSIAESGSGNVATVTATLSGASSAATEVTVSAAAVSPAAPGDFTLSSNKVLTIAAGATTSTGTVTIIAVDNDVDAPDKTVTVSGAASGGNGVADPAALTLTINDDEAAPVVTLALDLSSISESGSGNVARVTATLSGASSAVTEVTVSAAAVSPAVPGDFTLSSNKVLTIAAGATTSTGTVTITAVDNDVDAQDKTVTVSGAASGGNGVADPADATLTITDDEAAPTVTLVLDPSSISESGSGNIATVTATLSGASSAATRVTVSAAAVSPAVPGDFTLSSNKVLTIAAGATTSTGTVTVTAVDNDVDAPDKTVTVSGAASGGNGVADPADATLTVTDDEAAPVVTLALSPSSISESGSGNVARVTARLSGASSAATEVTVSAAAVSPAVPGDFTLSSNKVLTIAAGATTSTGTVTITPVDNAVDAPDKTVTVSGAASGGNGVADPSALMLTITDDEAAPTVTLALSPSSISESGSGNVATVTARLSGASSAATRVTVSAAAVSPALPGDFRLSSNKVLTIAAGATTSTGTVTITAVDNAVDAPDKTVTVSGAASGGNGVADPSALTLTITDDDAAGVTVSRAAVTVEENGGKDSFTMVLTSEPTANVTIAVSSSDTGAATVSPMSLTFTSSNWSSPRTVTVTGVNDPLGNADRSATITQVVSGGGDGVTAADVAVTVIDVNEAPVAYAGDDWTVAQNATIMLDGGESGDPEGGELSYSWRLVSGSATPKVMLRDADTASPTFVAPGGLTEDVILTFGLTVTDELGRISPEGRVAMTVSAAVSVVDGKVAFAPPASGRFVVHLRTALDAAVLPEASKAPAGMEFALPLDQIGEDGIARVSFDLAPADPPPPPGRLSGSAAVVDIALNDGRLTSLPGGATLCVPTNAPEREEMAVYRYEASGSRWLPLPTPRAETRAGIAVVCAETRTLGLFALFYPIVSSADADRARIAEHWLARFGRTVASQAVDMIGARLDGSLPPTGPSRMTLGGQTVEFGVPVSASGVDRDPFIFPSAGIDDDPVFQRRAQTRSMSTREFLLGSSFQLSTADDDDTASEPDGVWTLWGRAAASEFESVPEDALSLKGDVVSGWIGLDYTRERSMAGLAVSYVDGRGDFDLGIEEGRSEVASSLTSLYPYLRWSPREDLELWGLLGLGRGDMWIEDARGRVETEIGMRMAAAGGQTGLASAYGVDLSLKADALAVRMDSEGVVGLPAVDTEVQRVRLMLEGRSDWALSDDEWLRPSLELGARLDTGDAETGPGLELGGGLAYENRRLGLSVEARGRWLAKHRDEDFEEWGASLEVRLDPGASGLGPSFSLIPVWGRASSGIDALWEDEASSLPGGFSTKEATSTTPDRLDVEIGYGLRALGGRGVMTAYGELVLEDGQVRRVQEGLRLTAPNVANGFGLEFYAEQVLREGADLEHRIGLTGSLRF